VVASSEKLPNTTPLALAPWLVLGAGIALCLLVARDAFSMLTSHWTIRPEYSHGLLIPFISAYLVWRRRELLGDRLAGGWVGVVVVLASLALWVLGRLSSIQTVTQYALLGMLYGVVISSFGPRVFVRLWAPMLMLFLAIPLPQFLYNNLSSQLQLVSSALGVAMLRLCGISVYLSGNVIDLGHFQMQVVEACDGLRYLFPLMTLGFIVAYFFQAPVWQRAFVFLSSIPITIGMNSLRIAMIGVFADLGNTSLAEGLLHELQGWVLFMASGALLLGITWVLVRLTAPGTEWRRALGLTDHGGTPFAARAPTNVPRSLTVAAALLAAAVALSYVVPERAEATPERRWFVDFPLTFDGWNGKHGRIENQYVDWLALDDYLMADFSNGSNVVNVYAAYYESQRDGASVHSPRSCIPGGGWRILDFTHARIGEGADGFAVNRVLISLGDQRQLVYYWFKQRDRELTSEYAVKWYILVDSLLKRRSDGALVRLITPVQSGEDLARADERLRAFAVAARAEMRPFLPD
jgi:exosortase D (VPLPA-CTERM-specific)